MHGLKHAWFVMWLTVIAGAGCSSSSVSVNPTGNGPPLPGELRKAVLSEFGVSLAVRLYLDDDPARVANNVKVATDGRTLADFQIALPVGSHSLYLEYLITDTSCGPEPIAVARTTTLRDVVISADAPTIDFSVATIEQLFDDDFDGVSNVAEWQAGTFPCVPAPGPAAPSSPTNLRLMPGDGQITVQWDSVDGATAYNVYYAITPTLSTASYISQGGTRAAGVSNPHTISGLGNGTRYYILVTANNADAESVAVAGSAVPAAAPATEFSVNVTVRGLQGTLVLNNGSEDLSLTRDGNFAFPTLLGTATAYNVTVKTQPANQTCTVGAGAQGIIDKSHIFGIDVNCDLPLYNVFVAVAGLQGNGLVLQNNGKDDLPVATTGQVKFATPLASGQRYGVSVRTQPAMPGEPTERCIVVNSSGVVAQSDITTVGIECTVPPIPNFTIGGVVNGLKGQVVLRNGRDELIVAQSGAFSFALPMAGGVNYNVAIVQQPSSQSCMLGNASGTVATANIDTIVVTCSDTLVLDANPLSREVELTWNGDDVAAYHLYVATAPNCDLANYTRCAGGRKVLNVTSPYRLTALANDQTHFFRLEARYPGVPAMLSQEVRARPAVLHPNGAVLDIKNAGNGTSYLAGEFTRFVAGPLSGSATLDRRTGKTSAVFAIVGNVGAVVSDGAGGWYIGGTFTQVNGVARQNLAHILADDSFDAAFDVPVDGGVDALLLHAGRLYVGGRFSMVGNVDRPALAAIDVSTNAVTVWRPAPNGPVMTLAAQGARIFAGGRFSEIGGVADHAPVAAFDADGVLQAWNPSMSFVDGFPPYVGTIATGAGRIFVAGYFVSVGGQPTDSLVAFLDNATLDRDWVFNDDNATAAGVSQVRFSGADLYVAGFPDWALRDSNNFLLALNPIDGAQQKTIAGLGQSIPALAVHENTLYGIGVYSTTIAAIDVSGTGRVVWRKTVNDALYNLALDGDRLFIATSERTQWHDRGAVRAGVAALNAEGDLLDWDPRPDGNVAKLAVTDKAVYLLGKFNNVDGTARNYLAAVDHAGTVLDWNPGALGTIPIDGIHAMLPVNDTVYFGGQFTEFAGHARINTAAIDANGGVTSWNPTTSSTTANNVVRAMAHGVTFDNIDRMFIGGEFTHVDGVSRHNLAAVGLDGVVHDWIVDADRGVSRLLRSGDTLYVGGFFDTLRDLGRSTIAAVTVGGTVLDSSRRLDGVYSEQRIRTMALANGKLFAAGSFGAVDGKSGQGLVALGSSILDVLPWMPAPDDNVVAIAPHPTNGKIYLGGRFRYVEGRLQPYLAEVAAPTP